MDAEHRHELKTNELAEWLGQLPQFLKDNINTIIGVVLICAGIITWPMFSRMSKQKERVEQAEMTQSIQMLDQDVYNVLQAPADDVTAQTEALNTMLVNADALMEKASEVDNPNLAALARIKAAQAIRTELHLRKEVDAEMLENQIQKARDAYQQAFETAETPTLRAMAQFGLGLCSEELGQTSQAAEIYQQILDDESYQATVFPSQAQQRLDSLEENAEVFTFAEVPVADEESSEEIPESSPAEMADSTEELIPQSVPEGQEMTGGIEEAPAETTQTQTTE